VRTVLTLAALPLLAAAAWAGDDPPAANPPPARAADLADPVPLHADGKLIDHGPAWGHCGPTFADVDGDGLADLVVGDFSGQFTVYRNTGTATGPKFATGQLLKAGGEVAKVPIY
jgi:hypothetical protein